MQLNVVDNQLVGEVEAQIFELVQQSVIDAHVFLTNQGTNTINFRFQTLAPDGTWANMGAQGSVFYETLMAGQTKSIVLASSGVRIKMLGNASGGSSLLFAINRHHNRAAGAAIPILAL